MKTKEKEKSIVDILLDSETAYLIDSTTIQRVSLNKFVFTHGHRVTASG